MWKRRDRPNEVHRDIDRSRHRCRDARRRPVLPGGSGVQAQTSRPQEGVEVEKMGNIGARCGDAASATVEKAHNPVDGLLPADTLGR
jgi:hypothetical protein